MITPIGFIVGGSMLATSLGIAVYTALVWRERVVPEEVMAAWFIAGGVGLLWPELLVGATLALVVGALVLDLFDAWRNGGL